MHEFTVKARGANKVTEVSGVAALRATAAFVKEHDGLDGAREALSVRKFVDSVGGWSAAEELISILETAKGF